jgi:hypothetical protein
MKLKRDSQAQNLLKRAKLTGRSQRYIICSSDPSTALPDLQVSHNLKVFNTVLLILTAQLNIQHPSGV